MRSATPRLPGPAPRRRLRRARATRADARAVRIGSRGSARGDADGRQGPRLPRRHARGGARRRSHASVSRLPRRGADIRAGHAAGRPGGPGRATVGACSCRRSRPTARSIQLAAHHDADGFLAEELARRRALSYPPFASLIRVVCSAPDPADARPWRARLRAMITPPGAIVLGPAPLFRLRGRARRQLVVKASDRAAAIAAVGAAVEQRRARGRQARGQRQRRRRSPVGCTSGVGTRGGCLARCAGSHPH